MATVNVKFKHWNCRLKVGYYAQGRVALTLADDEGPVAVATVNMPEVPLKEGEVCIKDYSENEGMVAALAAAGVIEPEPLYTVPSGFVQIPVCRLTEAGKAFVRGGR